MKRLLLALTFGLLVAGGSTQQAQAALISGTIDMSGTATLNNTLLGSATGATAFSAVVVGGTPTGTFTGTAGASVLWNAFNWAPASTPVNPLWSFTSGGNTYSFRLDSVTVVGQSNTFLNLLGAGVLSATGFDNTPGTWSFTISNSKGGPHANFKFTFANSQTASQTPEGGSAMTMLGLGIIGLGALRMVQKRKK